MDDGSTDDSLMVAKRFESAKCEVVRQENAGACRARNHAFELCQGEYIQYLDADDLLPANKIQIQLNALQSSDNSDSIALAQWIKFLKIPGDLQKESGNWCSWDSGKNLLLGFDPYREFIVSQQQSSDNSQYPENAEY